MPAAFKNVQSLNKLYSAEVLNESSYKEIRTHILGKRVVKCKGMLI